MKTTPVSWSISQLSSNKMICVSSLGVALNIIEHILTRFQVDPGWVKIISGETHRINLWYWQFRPIPCNVATWNHHAHHKYTHKQIQTESTKHIHRVNVVFNKCKSNKVRLVVKSETTWIHHQQPDSAACVASNFCSNSFLLPNSSPARPGVFGQALVFSKFWYKSSIC